MNLTPEAITALLLDLKANVQALEELAAALAAAAPAAQRAGALHAYAIVAEEARVSSLYKRTSNAQNAALNRHLDRLAATLRGLG